MVDFDLSNVSEDFLSINPELREHLAKAKKPSKYRNVRASAKGMSFDSGKEAADAQKFLLGVRQGEWIAYLHHVHFPLPGKTYYEADHVLVNKDLTVSVYDSKGGVRTKEYLLKKRLFKERYGNEIIEI